MMKRYSKTTIRKLRELLGGTSTDEVVAGIVQRAGDDRYSRIAEASLRRAVAIEIAEEIKHEIKFTYEDCEIEELKAELADSMAAIAKLEAEIESLCKEVK